MKLERNGFDGARSCCQSCKNNFGTSMRVAEGGEFLNLRVRANGMREYGFDGAEFTASYATTFSVYL